MLLRHVTGQLYYSRDRAGGAKHDPLQTPSLHVHLLLLHPYLCPSEPKPLPLRHWLHVRVYGLDCVTLKGTSRFRFLAFVLLAALPTVCQNRELYNF